MTLSWVVVANASNAKIYETPRAKILNGGNALKLVEEILHPQSRQKEGDLTSNVSGHGNILETAKPKEQEHLKFAKEIIARLEEARNNHAYEDVILVAPASFMGQLNKNLSHALKPLVSCTIEKDYTKLDEEVINTRLADNLH